MPITITPLEFNMQFLALLENLIAQFLALLMEKLLELFRIEAERMAAEARRRTGALAPRCRCSRRPRRGTRST